MNTKFLIVFLFLFGWVSDLLSQSIGQVANEAKADLKNAINELAQLRDTIEKEKIPLARNVAILETKARKLRNELEHNLRLRDNRETSLLQLQDEVKEGETELDYSLSLLRDYAASWHYAIPPAEDVLWSSQLSAILFEQEEADTRIKEFEVFLDAMSLSISSIHNVCGGVSFTGNAIVPPEGTREEGTFWSLGPIIFFSGINGSAGFIEDGIADRYEQKLSLSARSVLKSSPVRLSPASKETSLIINSALSPDSINGKIPILPLDPTLAKALVMEKGDLSMIEELQKGGIWIYPIVFFAVLSLMIALFKAMQVINIQVPIKPASLDGLFHGPFELLRKTAKGYQGKSPEILEEILYEAIIDMQVKLEKALPLIAVTAATAPLLGLLGTVTGMIDVFRQITNFANPENSELARGISEALVTTKFGLITAIPSLIAHALLTRRLQGIISKMEGFSARLVRLKQEESETIIKGNADDADS